MAAVLVAVDVVGGRRARCRPHNWGVGALLTVQVGAVVVVVVVVVQLWRSRCSVRCTVAKSAQGAVLVAVDVGARRL